MPALTIKIVYALHRCHERNAPMATNDSEITVAAVGLSNDAIRDFERAGIGTVEFASLDLALAAVQSNFCSIVVMTQPDGWSLHRIGSAVRTAVGESSTIVLSPEGAAFAPGLYVIDQTITHCRLISLIRRVAPLDHGRHVTFPVVLQSTQAGFGGSYSLAERAG